MRAKVILDLEDRLSGRADKAMRRMQRMENRVNKTSSAADRAARSSGRMNGALAMASRFAGPVAVGASIYKSTKSAIDFESAMADVNKVVDFKSPHAFKQMESDILRLSTKLPMAANDIAAIVASAGQANIPTDQLLKFAESASKMGIAFDIGASEAGDVMAGLRTIFDRDQKGVIGLADAINHVSNNANATAPALLQVLQRSGAMARQFGLTAEQNTALAGTFLSLKVPPQVAGTAINSMLNKLGNADKQNKKFRGGMKALGITTKQWSEMMKKDAQGALNTFLNKLDGSKDKKGIIFDMFGLEYSDDIARLLSNMKEYSRQQDLVSDPSKYSGSMEKEYAARAATTANNLQLLKNNMAKLGINTGNTLLPPLNRVIEATNSWLSNLENVATIFDKIGAAAQGFSQGLGFEGVGDAVDQLTKPLQRLWTALSPAQGDPGETLARIFMRAKGAGESFTAWLDSVDQKLNLGERFASMKADIGPRLEDLRSFAEERVARVQEIAASIDIDALTASVAPKLERFSSQIVNHYQMIADGLSKFAGDFEISTDMEAWTGDVLTSAADTLAGVVESATGALRIIDNGLTYIGGMFEGIAQGLGFENTGQAAGAAFDKVLGVIKWTWDKASWFMKTVGGLFTSVADATEVEDPAAVVSTWKTRTELVVSVIKQVGVMISDLVSEFERIFADVVERVQSMTKTVQGWLQKLNSLNPLRELTPEEKTQKQRTDLQDQKSEATGSLGGIANPWGPGNNWAEGVDLSNKLNQGKISLEEFRAKMAEVIAEGGRWSEVATKMDSVAAKAQEIQTKIDAIDLAASGQKIMNSLAQGIRNGTPAVAAASSAAAAQVKGHFPHSPAKYGPLRSLSGMGTVNQIARTMKTGPLVAASRRLAAVVSNEAGGDAVSRLRVVASATDSVQSAGESSTATQSRSPLGSNPSASAGRSTVLQGGIHIHITGSPDPEATAAAVNDALSAELDAVLGD